MIGALSTVLMLLVAVDVPSAWKGFVTIHLQGTARSSPTTSRNENMKWRRCKRKGNRKSSLAFTKLLDEAGF